MTHEEMIAVIQAHKEGKKIQARMKADKNEEWIDLIDVSFDFSSSDYRINPKPYYRPFKSAGEVMEAIREHGSYVYHKKYKWYRLIGFINNDYIEMTCQRDPESWGYTDMLNKCTFADGTPFGVKED